MPGTGQPSSQPGPGNESAGGTSTVPFRIEFVEKKYASNNPLPGLQSYAIAVTKSGKWIISGGRSQGLHTFKGAPAKNFLPNLSNNFIYLVNPLDGSFTSFDVNTLPPDISAPLQANNQQYYYDKETDMMYIVGGYGWNVGQTNMLTFNTIMRYKVSDMELAMSSSPSADMINGLIARSSNDIFAVTGGALFRMGAEFYLVFGQRFDQQYRAFGGSDFTQKYTEEVRIFKLKPGSLDVLSAGATTNTAPDHPFHRRDGNIVNDLDPTTGAPRITALGGVFEPGVIGAYTYPIYIYGTGTPSMNRYISQKFCQYQCPVISVYNNTGNLLPAVYHTFFAGISHYYYSQTPSQHDAYLKVTAEGRNDGFPFIADISTLVFRSDGSWDEYIQMDPTPGNRLVGSSVPFILSRSIMDNGYTYPNGVINLGKMPAGNRQLVGYIYGGVEAVNPLPLAANTGTTVSNSVFEVYLTPATTPVRPASQGIESTHNT
jgi:hypothetical protein